MKPINFLLVGVGGQGTILASDILAHVGAAAGLQVKQAELHGMSQRGGSVSSHVRWGDRVFSPIVGAGEGDVLVAFEELEAMRYLEMLHRDALIIGNHERIIPTSVTTGEYAYPTEQTMLAMFSRVTSHIIRVDGPGIAGRLGLAKAANSVVLGALARALAVHELVEPPVSDEIWLATIAERTPAKYRDLNRAAFCGGQDAMTLVGMA